jgi:hypothetical protein
MHDKIFKKINTLISSPLIMHYLVGITSDVVRRKNAYLNEGFPLFFILEDNLCQEDALNIECKIFSMVTEDKDSKLFLKYHPKKRNKRYHRSTGGKISTQNSYVVYIAAYGD